jgi:hypothetical protein
MISVLDVERGKEKRQNNKLKLVRNEVLERDEHLLDLLSMK